MASSSFPSSYIQQYPAVWLDALPLDVTLRIASHLPRTARNPEEADALPDTLSFAAVSHFQARAVARQTDLSIEHVIDAYHTTQLIRQWRNILRDIRSVRLPIDISYNDDVRSLLSLHSIEQISIPNYPSLVRPLQFLPALRSLELIITTYCPPDGERGLATDIPTVLRSCPIEELKILCRGCDEYSEDPCLAGSILRPLGYGDRCTTLTSLSIKSTCNKLEDVATLPAIFPNITDFTIEHWHFCDDFYFTRPVVIRLTDNILSCLKLVKRLSLLNCGSVDAFVPGLASNLVGLSSLTPVSSTDLFSLEIYINLRSLDLVVEDGAEMWFPKDLKHLRSLSLSWKRRDRLLLYDKYYHPPGAAISSILQRNRDLEELHLKNGLIEPSLLEDILSTVGKKLKVLGVSIFHQGEPPADRLFQLAQLLIRHNENITDLDMSTTSFGAFTHLPLFHYHENRTCDPLMCEFCALWRTAYMIYGLFRRRFTNLREDGLRTLLLSLQPCRSQMFQR